MSNSNVHGGGNIVDSVAAPMALSLQAQSVVRHLEQRSSADSQEMLSSHLCPAMARQCKEGMGQDNSENAAVAVGTCHSPWNNITLKPTRFAGAVDISKHLMYSQNGQLDDLFGRDLGNAIASCLTSMCLIRWWHDWRPMTRWHTWEQRPQQAPLLLPLILKMWEHWWASTSEATRTM